MVRAEETERHPPLIAGPGQPLIAIPMDDGTVWYFTSEADASIVRTDQTLQRALDLAGAWSDLDWDEAEAELDRIRHASEPSAPFTE